MSIDKKIFFADHNFSNFYSAAANRLATQHTMKLNQSRSVLSSQQQAYPVKIIVYSVGDMAIVIVYSVADMAIMTVFTVCCCSGLTWQT